MSTSLVLALRGHKKGLSLNVFEKKRLRDMGVRLEGYDFSPVILFCVRSLAGLLRKKNYMG